MVGSSSAFKIVVVVESVLSELDVFGWVFEELLHVVWGDSKCRFVVSGVIIDNGRAPLSSDISTCKQARASEREEKPFRQRPHQYRVPDPFLLYRLRKRATKPRLRGFTDLWEPVPAIERHARTPISRIADKPTTDRAHVDMIVAYVIPAHGLASTGA
jgi:hypothetical protein